MPDAVTTGLPNGDVSVNSLDAATITATVAITLPDEFDRHRFRVGCDVMAVQEVADSLASFGDRYLRKVFTTGEIDDCQGGNVHGLAARFAAKEAVIKAFAEPGTPFPLREIEITHDGPLPRLRLTGSMAERAQRQGWLSSSVSLSHTDCHAMAVVVAACRSDAS